MQLEHAWQLAIFQLCVVRPFVIWLGSKSVHMHMLNQQSTVLYYSNSNFIWIYSTGYSVC